MYYIQQFGQSLSIMIATLKVYLPDVLLAFAIIWGVNFINWFILRSRLNLLGIYPRHLFGLVGIIFSPILHGNFSHLLFNSLPAFALTCLILTSGLKVFLAVTFVVVLVGGFLTWLLGRKAIHIGMSGLIAGYFGFLLVNAIEHPGLVSIGLAIIVIYYFGGILLSLLPSDERVSWEGHLFGFIAGLLASFIYPQVIYYYFLLYYHFK